MLSYAVGLRLARHQHEHGAVDDAGRHVSALEVAADADELVGRVVAHRAREEAGDLLTAKDDVGEAVEAALAPDGLLALALA